MRDEGSRKVPKLCELVYLASRNCLQQFRPTANASYYNILVVSQGQNINYKNNKCQVSSLTMAFIKCFCSMSTENMFAL